MLVKTQPLFIIDSKNFSFDFLSFLLSSEPVAVWLLYVYAVLHRHESYMFNTMNEKNSLRRMNFIGINIT